MTTPQRPVSLTKKPASSREKKRVQKRNHPYRYERPRRAYNLAFKAVDGEKRTLLDALILMVSPVLGLRPLRAAR